jgi:hypothetical protein
MRVPENSGSILPSMPRGVRQDACDVNAGLRLVAGRRRPRLVDPESSILNPRS